MYLSIITINYNNREGLLKTINSVISQSCQDYEWIIVDGGSKDGSKELIEQNQSKIAWWCSEPDKGIYNAMNKGISHSHGDYCLFLNSGDCFYDKEVLQEINFNVYSSDLVYGDMLDSNTGKPIGNFKGENITLADFFYSSFPHQATLIRRELFTKWGGYDERYKVVSDWKFFMEMVIQHNVSIKYLGKPISLFDNTGVSSCAEPGSESRLVFKELIPNRILVDYSTFLSAKEIFANRFTRILYSMLYRLAVIINRKR